MQFVKSGPVIPEHLILAHEEGRVIFFCGAGISYPAGLPGFGGLVEKLYAGLGTERDALEQAAFKQGRYDTTVGLLENRHPGGRRAVREQLAKVLTPELKHRPHATQTHEALLTLSRSPKGQCRLVTTNFDRLFQKVIMDKKLDIPCFEAPFLPIPKNRWNGIVYLHGLLPEDLTEEVSNRLVISSGDFGLAYLTERWAARFVAELFRGYTVCFVGYSINDPVMRYMMDALAADKLMGEAPIQAFAFGSYKKGKQSAAEEEWNSKNVTPILYLETKTHRRLHETLRVWSEVYRDGVRGREAIVTQYARTVPTGSTAEDDFVGRMLWALSDKMGLPAKRFAEFDPAPSLDWLEVLTDRRFGHRDLLRFRVQPNGEKDEKLAFSLAIRPSPYTHAPWMAPVLLRGLAGQWDEVMTQIARWLARHLDDPKLLLWVGAHGGQLHPQFMAMISWEISQRQKNGPPLSLPMQRLWRVVIAGRLQQTGLNSTGLYDWMAELKRDGLSPSLIWRFRQELAAYVKLSKPFAFSRGGDGHENSATNNRSVSDLVRWEVVLATENTHYAIKEFSSIEQWREALPALLPVLTVLLRDALDIMRELQGADDHHDLSYIAQPSISPHEQNSDFHDWTALIELTRDAWLAAADRQPDVAGSEAKRWTAIPYPLFRRLAFFAAAQRPDIVPPSESIPWLLADDRRWLWTVETVPEATRLIVSLAPILPSEQSNALQGEILKGPPRYLYANDIEPDCLQQHIDYETWLRLIKYRDAGGVLSSGASERLRAFSQKYPEWQLTSDERNEFRIWRGGGGELRTIQPVPKSRRELQGYLAENTSTADWETGDDWAERCANDFPRTATALCGLARRGIWPVSRWRYALQAWATEKLLTRSWKYGSRILANIPDNELKELARPVAWWLETVSKNFRGNETVFFDLIRRILALLENDPADLSGDVISRAINHPVGLATQAALRWWYRQNLQDDQGLEGEIATLFSEVSTPNATGLRYGCVILAGNLISLYRVDHAWTKKHLLAYFDWDANQDIAPAMWQYFLHSPRLYWPLLDAIKSSVLATAKHYNKLGSGIGIQYIGLLTYAALSPDASYTEGDFKLAINTLPSEALGKIAETLFRALQGAGERRTEYLQNRIKPFMKRLWPKTLAARTPDVSSNFAKLCAVSGEAFLEAMNLFKDWLQPINDVSYVVHLLNESGACKHFPEKALEFLSMVVPEDISWFPLELKSCLEAIRLEQPVLLADQRYQRLSLLQQQRGH